MNLYSNLEIHLSKQVLFWGCTSLQSVNIPNQSYLSVDMRSKIARRSNQSPSQTRLNYGNAFENCSLLQSVTIGNSVETIGDGAFASCSSLKSVNILNSVKTIGSCAFHQCSSLQSVTIPNSVTSIGKWAFIDCDKLNQASIPKHLEETIREIEVFPEHTKIIVR